MNILSVVHAGILATAAMTASLYITAWITHANVKVVKILGTMLTNQTGKDGSCSNNPFVIGIGLVVHYLVGVAFATCYWLLLRYQLVSDGLSDALIFGSVIGVLAISVWRVYFSIHAKPPKVPLLLFLFLIFVGHIVLALVLKALYSGAGAD
jgi:hypothetical protein